MKITPQREITVDLAAYHRVGADWALLGRLFRAGMDEEVSAMKKQIREQLEK